MKRINVVHILGVVLVLEILLSTVAYSEPSFTTANVERFDVSKITQNQAVNVVDEKWTFNSSTNYLEISMRKASAFESSLYDVGVPVNTPLVGNPAFHARLFVSNLNVSDDLIRAFIVLANETHVIELNYLIGKEQEDDIPDPKAPNYIYLYTSISNATNDWVTIDRDIIGDLAAKNVSIETDGSWKISGFSIGGILYQKNELAAPIILVDVNQTYLDFGGIKVYSGNASVNTPIILLIAGLFIFSSLVLVVESIKFQRRNKTTMKNQKGDVLMKAALILVLQGALLTRLVFLDFGQLASDESIYTYTSYLIVKGVLPYKEVFMAHPPLSFYLTAFFIWVLGPSYPFIRLLSVGIFLGTVMMTYLLSKVALGKIDGKYSLFVAVLYASYPSWFILNTVVSTLENLLTLFTLLSTFFYILYLRKSKSRYLFISGFSGGCALLITMRAVFFLASLAIFHSIYVVWKRKPRAFFGNVLAFVAGFAFPTGLTLGLLAASNALRYFYLNVITYQASLFRMSLSVRLGYLAQYVTNQWPLLFFAGFGISLAAKRIMESRDISPTIPGFVFFLNLFFFSIFGFFMHYLQFLGPFLSVISVLGMKEMKEKILGDAHRRARSKAIVIIFLVILGIFSYATVTNFYQISSYFQRNPYDKVNYYIGKRIANITSPSDHIWSGDAAIGFFSKRMIVAPSADFRFIGISDSIIGFDYGNDRGAEMQGYNDGFVTVEDFIESWESKRVKVLVFIMNKGWVPYVDPLLWNGYRDHIGVAEYVSREYELLEVVFGEDVPHVYYIWVRRE